MYRAGIHWPNIQTGWLETHVRVTDSENREGAATLQAQGRNPKMEASALWQNFPTSLFQKDFQCNVSR